jgi:hypothetical protein
LPKEAKLLVGDRGTFEKFFTYEKESGPVITPRTRR